MAVKRRLDYLSDVFRHRDGACMVFIEDDDVRKPNDVAPKSHLAAFRRELRLRSSWSASAIKWSSGCHWFHESLLHRSTANAPALIAATALYQLLF